MADDGPGGWGILHDRRALHEDTGLGLYMFGPLPTREAADFLMSATKCGCVLALVPLFFPAGVVMAVALDDFISAASVEPIH
jgi:hypothetical protein